MNTMPSASRRRSLARTVRSIASRLYYEGVVRPTLQRTVETRMLGFTLSVPPTVFHPKFYFTSRILGSYIQSLDLRGKNALDVGCGSGILSLAAASVGASITAVDINPAAVAATKVNALRNGLAERIHVLESDLCLGLPAGPGQIDLIITNPPYYRKDPGTPAERAFHGGASNEFMVKLAEASLEVLSSEGSILLVLSSDVDESRSLEPFTSKAFQQTTLVETRRFLELLRVIRLDRVATSIESDEQSSTRS